MKQVFFKTQDALQGAGTAGDDRFSDLASGELGFWTPDASTGGAWFASALFENRFVIADTDSADNAAASVSPTLTMSGGNFLKERIQVVQGFGSGNPIASPIISTSNIIRVDASGHDVTVPYKIIYTPGTNEKVASNELEFKFVVRQGSTSYLDFVNNEAAFADLIDGTHRFPLSGFHNNNHKIINISIVTGGGSDQNVCDALRTAIQNHGVLNAMIKTSGSTTAVLQARHPGVVFEIIGHNLTDDVAIPAGGFGLTDFVPGVGNAWQARTDELRARSQQGDFNRMYFPMSQTDFVTSATAVYDRYEITYKIDGDRNVVKGSQYGTAIIYEVDGQNDLGAVLNRGTADPSTNKVEYVWG